MLDVGVSLSAILITVPSISFAWASTGPYPPFSRAMPSWALLSMYLGWVIHCTIKHAVGHQDSDPPRAKLTLMIVLALVVPIWFTKHTLMHYHPIDLLIYDAKIQHDTYVNLNSPPGTLAQAVHNYQARYKRNPPPGFDIWYDYAVNRSCIIIDEYDQIHNDLLPFYSLSPEQIRQLTWEIASNQWNEASGLRIRDGNAIVQDNVVPTHRWMIEGVATFINSFAQHLPDMDLVFNINDEPRVVAPFSKLRDAREAGRRVALTGKESWSPDRAALWQPEATDFPHRNFRGMSFVQHFYDWGSVGCPPHSPARRGSLVFDSRSQLCTACTAPHSLGQFVANWTLAADICHQPDMANLHGFYMSPAAFKPAYALKPVFSQSKPHGFNDILYPSAWNYMDKVKYDPSSEPRGQPGEDDYRPAYPDPTFAEKNSTLFWRGATSEGVSGGAGQWRGMTRQRLVHLANNATSHPHDAVQILLPHIKYHEKWEYVTLPGNRVKELGLGTDIRIVDHIARCGGEYNVDCVEQEKEFAPIKGTDFQAHWSYKYLFDLDGAGFSGRFLPFLQSRSLPFKSALFREWYDSRLTAWCHFVPQDLRLHGLWSTLAYFAGVDGRLPGGRRVRWAGHEREAELIAEEGRVWANKVLRKEDMEVYFFRLLLEWGRMTDDNRENLGFVLD
jgi:hypothetical protein